MEEDKYKESKLLTRFISEREKMKVSIAKKMFTRAVVKALASKYTPEEFHIILKNAEESTKRNMLTPTDKVIEIEGKTEK